jgi:hypothetical protein
MLTSKVLAVVQSRLKRGLAETQAMDWGRLGKTKSTSQLGHTGRLPYTFFPSRVDI